ncbi:MAG: protein phosphatase 2C domain-containing protein [Propionibacteriaceae bacterium]|jgi:protein phosphatase|nr:protein phosphatase 2C domain-containing protein [Propionibacteriaceae bacterium]
MRVECSGTSDVGLVRSHNEDDFFVGQQIIAVADGMGGQAAGEVASHVVVDMLRECDSGERLHKSDIIKLLADVNTKLLCYGDENPEARGLGSTVAGLATVFIGDVEHWLVFNIGDSRVYRHHDGALQRLTTDHNEVQSLLAAGLVSEDEARTHPSRTVLTRSLGSRVPPRADTMLVPKLAGDAFVLCSDGLSSEVGDDEIAAIVGECPAAPAEVAQRLVHAALAAGGADNVTVVAVWVGDAEQSDLLAGIYEDTQPRPVEGETRVEE